MALLRAGYRDDSESRRLVNESLSNDHDRIRVLALRAGARHGYLSSTQWRSAFRDPSSDVRREAAVLLAYNATAPNDVTSLLLEALNDSEPLVIDAVAFALGERHVLEAVGPLGNIARTHEDARCRESAIASLGMIGDPSSAEIIIAALDDKAPIRRRAVVALSNFEGPAVEAALARASDDRDWQVRAAIDQLQRGPLSDD